jgi:hypothetical protein
MVYSLSFFIPMNPDKFLYNTGGKKYIKLHPTISSHTHFSHSKTLNLYNFKRKKFLSSLSQFITFSNLLTATVNNSAYKYFCSRVLQAFFVLITGLFTHTSSLLGSALNMPQLLFAPSIYDFFTSINFLAKRCKSMTR